MDNNNKHYHKPNIDSKWWKTKSGIVICFFFCIIIFLLVMEHWVHIYPFLPWLILLVCPLMHMFHHGGHKKSNKNEKE